MDSDRDRVNCTCDIPDARTGYCPVRGREIPAHFIRLCRDDVRYRYAFDGTPKRKGPPPRQGPGHARPCIHRGVLLLSVPCHVGRQSVFLCKHFDEPVTPRPLSRAGAEFIRERGTIATPGRSCQECEARELKE